MATYVDSLAGNALRPFLEAAETLKQAASLLNSKPYLTQRVHIYNYWRIRTENSFCSLFLKGLKFHSGFWVSLHFPTFKRDVLSTGPHELKASRKPEVLTNFCFQHNQKRRCHRLRVKRVQTISTSRFCAVS